MRGVSWRRLRSALAPSAARCQRERSRQVLGLPRTVKATGRRQETSPQRPPERTRANRPDRRRPRSAPGAHAGQIPKRLVRLEPTAEDQAAAAGHRGGGHSE